MDSEDRSTQKDTSSSAVASSLSDLIARLEKATGPDRELDEQIQAAISGATLEKQADGRNAYHRDGFWISIGKVLPYTSSIDAAMTLVPEGYDFLLSGVTGDFSAEVGPENSFQTNQAQHVISTPAIALCIANLKALSQIESLPANDSAETRLEI